MYDNLLLISAGVLHYDNHQSAVCSVAAIAGPATSDLTAGLGKDKYLTAYLRCRIRTWIPIPYGYPSQKLVQ